MVDTSLLIFATFGAFFFSVIFFSIVKKLFYYFFFKKRIYIIPRLSIKGIGYLAIIVALSVAIIIILTIYTGDLAAIFFRAFPGTRITFESLLIKVGGLLLGPLLGMVLGAVTDGLTIVFTAGVFHYGYFMAAIAFGLIGGLIRILIQVAKDKEKLFVLIGNILIIIVTMLIFLFYSFTDFKPVGGNVGNDVISNWNEVALVPILNLEIKMIYLLWIIVGFGALVLIAFNLFFVLSIKSKAKVFHKQFNAFGPIFLLAYFSEIMISIFLLPIVDVNLVSSISYASWVGIRILTSIPLLIFNVIIIYPIYKSISKVFKYNYLDDYEIDDADLLNLRANYIQKVQLEKLQNFEIDKKQKNQTTLELKKSQIDKGSKNEKQRKNN